MSYSLNIPLPSLDGCTTSTLTHLDAQSLAVWIVEYWGGLYGRDEDDNLYTYNSNKCIHTPEKNLKQHVESFCDSILLPALEAERQKIADVIAELSEGDEAAPVPEYLTNALKNVNKYYNGFGKSIGCGYATNISQLTSQVRVTLLKKKVAKILGLKDGYNFGGVYYDSTGHAQTRLAHASYIALHGTPWEVGNVEDAKVFMARLRKAYPDPDKLKYFQKQVGRLMTYNSKTLAHMLGETNVGKSFLMSLIMESTVTYLGASGQDTIKGSKRELSAGDYSSIKAATSKQVCMVIDELDAGEALNLARIKSLTGGANLQYKRMGGDMETSYYQTSMLIITNHLSDRTQLTDPGVKSRITFLPEPVAFSSDLEVDGVVYRTVNDVKKHIVDNELSGVLAWVVEGIQLYHEDPAWIPACMAAYEDNMTGELGKGAIGDMFEMTGFVPMDEKVKVADGVPIRWLREAYKVAADLRSAPSMATMIQILQNAGFTLRLGDRKNGTLVLNLGFADPNDPENPMLVTRNMIDAYTTGTKNNRSWESNEISLTFRFLSVHYRSESLTHTNKEVQQKLTSGDGNVILFGSSAEAGYGDRPENRQGLDSIMPQPGAR